MDANKLLATKWFSLLRNELTAELSARRSGLEEQRPELEAEQQRLLKQRQGWALSLANPDLDPSVRAAIEADWTTALARLNEIAALLEEIESRLGGVDKLLDPVEAADKLRQLQDALASDNPTLGQLELAQHMDDIVCHADGRVTLRICKLGAFREALNLVTDPATKPQEPAEPLLPAIVRKGKPRRRARLRTDPLAPNASELKDSAHFAADPNRFAGVGDQWFWTECLQIPAKTCWASDHATEVARERAGGATMEQLAAHFKKTVPTIRDALRRAAQGDPAVGDLPRKMPRRRWAVDHAAEVADLKHQGLTVDEIAAKLGKSDTTIREALRYAQEREQSS